MTLSELCIVALPYRIPDRLRNHPHHWSVSFARIVSFVLHCAVAERTDEYIDQDG